MKKSTILATVAIISLGLFSFSVISIGGESGISINIIHIQDLFGKGNTSEESDIVLVRDEEDYGVFSEPSLPELPPRIPAEPTGGGTNIDGNRRYGSDTGSSDSDGYSLGYNEDTNKNIHTNEEVSANGYDHYDINSGETDDLTESVWEDWEDDWTTNTWVDWETDDWTSTEECVGDFIELVEYYSEGIDIEQHIAEDLSQEITDNSSPFIGYKADYYGNHYYSGYWFNDAPHDYGEMYYDDGSYYEGFWYDGVPHGYGEMDYYDGNCYEGYWHNGAWHGHGVYIYSNGGWEEGEFRNWEFWSGEGYHIFSDYILEFRVEGGVITYLY